MERLIGAALVALCLPLLASAQPPELLDMLGQRVTADRPEPTPRPTPWPSPQPFADARTATLSAEMAGSSLKAAGVSSSAAGESFVKQLGARYDRLRTRVSQLGTQDAEDPFLLSQEATRQAEQAKALESALRLEPAAKRLAACLRWRAAVELPTWFQGADPWSSLSNLALDEFTLDVRSLAGSAWSVTADCVVSYDSVQRDPWSQRPGPVQPMKKRTTWRTDLTEGEYRILAGSQSSTPVK